MHHPPPPPPPAESYLLQDLSFFTFVDHTFMKDGIIAVLVNLVSSSVNLQEKSQFMSKSNVGNVSFNTETSVVGFMKLCELVWPSGKALGW